MNIVNANIFNCIEPIIVHQVNCLGVMGSGIAYQIKLIYPEVYVDYHEFCQKRKPEEILGSCRICPTKDGRFIANVFGQLDFGSGVKTNYYALERALDGVRDFAKLKSYSVALPYNLGCGLAGGNWDIVSKIIERTLFDVDYTLYRLD